MDFEYSEDYLDEDDDGIMYTTRNYCSDSDDEDISSMVPMKRKTEAQKDVDDFEKDMAAELMNTMKKLTAPIISEVQNKPNECQYYDDIYFDSDESDEEHKTGDDSTMDSSACKGKNRKRRVLTNEELLYDPKMDDRDQAWVDRRRRSYVFRTIRPQTGKPGTKPHPLPKSDAVLNCPACFTTLCLDCQRHEIYKDQYRAMFVFNCEVDATEILKVAKKEGKRFKKGKRRYRSEAHSALDTNPAENVVTSEVSSPSSDPPHSQLLKEDDFHPVRCTICNTKVAVYDKDEVYHFFNVLSSY